MRSYLRLHPSRPEQLQLSRSSRARRRRRSSRLKLLLLQLLEAGALRCALPRRTAPPHANSPTTSRAAPSPHTNRSASSAV